MTIQRGADRAGGVSSWAGSPGGWWRGVDRGGQFALRGVLWLLCGVMGELMGESVGWGWQAPTPVPSTRATATRGAATDAPTDAAAPATADPRNGVATKPAADDWQALYLGKTRVGYLRSTITPLRRDGRELIESKSETAMTIARFGQRVQLKISQQTLETAAGEWLEFRSVMENPPNLATETVGRIEQGTLHLTTTVGGKATTRTQPWDATLQSPATQDRLLREKPLGPGDEQTFRTFEPQLQKVITVTLKGLPAEEVTLLSGERRSLRKIAASQSIDPKTIQYSYLDEELQTVKTTTSMLGTEMTTWAVTREEALKSLTGDDVDLAIATLVKTNKIERSLETRAVRYRVSLPAENPVDVLATGVTQTVRPIDDRTVELTVRSEIPPATPPADAQPVEPRYIQPSQFLQSEDPVVVELAESVAGDETDAWKVALALEQLVHRKVKNKNFSTLMASAAEVAKSLSGDCTEHACLLAALCRARQIPSRVVVGLMYVPRDSAFGGHMWTEVLVRGRWVPLDGTLGRGHVGGDHIKFRDSALEDGNANDGLASFVPVVNALAQLRIEVLEVTH